MQGISKEYTIMFKRIWNCFFRTNICYFSPIKERYREIEIELKEKYQIEHYIGKSAFFWFEYVFKIVGYDNFYHSLSLEEIGHNSSISIETKGLNPYSFIDRQAKVQYISFPFAHFILKKYYKIVMERYYTLKYPLKESLLRSNIDMMSREIYFLEGRLNKTPLLSTRINILKNRYFISSEKALELQETYRVYALLDPSWAMHFLNLKSAETNILNINKLHDIFMGLEELELISRKGMNYHEKIIWKDHLDTLLFLMKLLELYEVVSFPKRKNKAIASVFQQSGNKKLNYQSLRQITSEFQMNSITHENLPQRLGNNKNQYKEIYALIAKR